MALLREQEINQGNGQFYSFGNSRWCETKLRSKKVHFGYQKRFISVIKKAYCEGIFKRRDRVNSAFSKSKSEIKMKYLPKEIAFFTDGYFDFDDGLWKSGGRNIRKV